MGMKRHELVQDTAETIAKHIPVGNHLNYQFGERWWTSMLSTNGLVSLTEYDPMSDAAPSAYSEGKTPVTLLSNEQDLDDYRIGMGIERFDSASLTFVLHTNPRALAEVRAMLKPGAILTVLDYHLCGCPQDIFKKRFTAEEELVSIAEEGFDEAYLEHALVGLGSYSAWCGDAGFKRMISGWSVQRYCFWVGSSDK